MIRRHRQLFVRSGGWGVGGWGGGGSTAYAYDCDVSTYANSVCGNTGRHAHVNNFKRKGKDHTLMVMLSCKQCNQLEHIQAAVQQVESVNFTSSSSSSAWWSLACECGGGGVLMVCD